MSRAWIGLVLGAAVAIVSASPFGPDSAPAKESGDRVGWLAYSDATPKTPTTATGGARSTATAKEDTEEPDGTDILGANAACYVCHVTFVKEEMAAVHLKEKVGCIECHGPSEKHANDENIGATKPDITFKRDRIDVSCLKCHDTHDAPAKVVVMRFVQRKLPRQTTAVCTECHGMHKIEKAGKAETETATAELK